MGYLKEVLHQPEFEIEGERNFSSDNLSEPSITYTSLPELVSKPYRFRTEPYRFRTEPYPYRTEQYQYLAISQSIRPYLVLGLVKYMYGRVRIRTFVKYRFDCIANKLIDNKLGLMYYLK